MTVFETVECAVRALDDKMAREIQVLHIETVTTLADYFIICTATSNTHAKTLKEAVEHELELSDVRPHHVEGHGSGTWLLMDYSSVVIHIFTDEARKFYQLDRVWADAEVIDTENMVKKEN
ncbi:MAG: ribosome silencing factor [Clostridia bacterium]